MAEKKVIRAADMVADIRSGMNDAALMAKYDLSEKGLRIAYRKLLNQRAGLAREIVADIRAGMTEFELLQKYHLTCRGLQSALRRLVRKSYIDPDEVFGRSTAYQSAITVEDLRGVPRNHTVCPIQIFELSNIENNGTIRDISEMGLGTRGIVSDKDEIKEFIIRDDELGEFGTFSFSARCRWVHTDSEGSPVAGFEILSMSQRDRMELDSLIDAISIEVDDEEDADLAD